MQFSGHKNKLKNKLISPENTVILSKEQHERLTRTARRTARSSGTQTTTPIDKLPDCLSYQTLLYRKQQETNKKC